jgi:hypothetical protein
MLTSPPVVSRGRTGVKYIMSKIGDSGETTTISNQKARMLQRVATLRNLEKKFLQERDEFAFAETPYALFTAIDGRERWGIWRLLPTGPAMEESWAEFDLLAAAAIDAIGLLPLRKPTALEFDSDWSRPEDPQGLDAVQESTRAWLDFLRTEWVKRKREEFDPITLRNVWTASASQCKVSARDCKMAAYRGIEYTVVDKNEEIIEAQAVPVPQEKLPQKVGKGDFTLLSGKKDVRFQVAECYLGISKRQRQSLVASGVLQLTGQGSNKKVTTESVLKYLPAREEK